VKIGITANNFFGWWKKASKEWGENKGLLTYPNFGGEINWKPIWPRKL